MQWGNKLWHFLHAPLGGASRQAGGRWRALCWERRRRLVAGRWGGRRERHGVIFILLYAGLLIWMARLGPALQAEEEKKKKQQRSLVSRSACKNMNMGYKDKTPSAYLKIRAAQTGIVTVYKKGAQTSRYLSTVTEKQVMAHHAYKWKMHIQMDSGLFLLLHEVCVQESHTFGLGPVCNNGGKI